MMKRWMTLCLAIALCCIADSPASGQRLYTMHQIIHAADSALRTYVGDTLFTHFQRERLIEYLMADSVAGSWQGYLTDTSNAIYGRLILVDVDYWYSFTYAKCPQLPPFSGHAHIELDSTFNQTNRPWFDVLPERILKNLPCNFISREDALRIALEHNLVAGPDSITTDLYYYHVVKDYVWRVTKGCRNENGSPGSDMVMMNAVTGSVLLHEKIFAPPPLMEDYGG